MWKRKYFIRTWLLAVWWALRADPKHILGPVDPMGGPYARWVVRIAKIKRRLLPWHWGS